ncbi:hypothetical protein ACP4OV_024707 [Aristida adscensionis]
MRTSLGGGAESSAGDQKTSRPSNVFILRTEHARILLLLSAGRSRHTPLHSGTPPTTPPLRTQGKGKGSEVAAAMSWLARSIAATLSSAHSDDEGSDAASGDASPPRPRAPSHPAGADAGEPEQPDTPSRGGVKGDISELTESLTRRFWGVASFLAPPPAAGEGEGEGEEETEAEEEEAAVAAAGPEELEEQESQSPRIAGIRSDLAEIGGRVRSGISMLSNANAVTEISRIASSFLTFGPGEEEGEAVGVTEEAVVFVRHISMHPETWLDFPLFADGRLTDDFELSDTQYGHALAMEHLVPSLSYLRTKLCSTSMSEACFWKIYFVLLHSILNNQDAELLSTPEILKAREELLQSSPKKNQLVSEGLGVVEESSENKNVLSTEPKDKDLSPSSIKNKNGTFEAQSSQEPTSDPTADIEANKYPVSTPEPEIVDKSVIQEELVLKNEINCVPNEKSGHLYTAETDDDKEVEEWLQDMVTVPSKTGYPTAAGEEEDVSFSDLEDD